MKKKVIVSLLAFAVLLSGCNTATKPDSDKDSKDEEVKISKTDETIVSDESKEEVSETEVTEATEESEETEETEATEESEETEATEETEASESSDSNSDDMNAAKAEAESALREKLSETAGDSEILSFTCDDFDLDGTYEAFAFIGEENDYDGEILYSGKFYFVNDENVEMIHESYPVEFADCGTIIDFGTRKYFHIKQIYTTAGISYLYTVKDNNCYAEAYSGIGSLYDLNGNDFSLTLSAYDGVFDKEMETTLGHTWKPYYFHYDPSADSIVEYVGESISVEIAFDTLPAGVMDEILEQGYTFGDMFMRDNGVINVNYEKEENNSIYYSNVNYNMVTGEFMDAWGNGADTWDDSDFGGIYYSSIYGE